MSFTDQYNALKKKREEEEKKKKTSSFEEQYQQLKAETSEQKITLPSPVGKDKIFSSGLDIAGWQAKKEAEKKAETPFVDKSVFDDGYQFGDVARAILGTGDNAASLLDLTWNSAKRGYYTALYGEESFKDMDGLANQKDVYKKILEGDDYQFAPGTQIASGISGAFEMLGQQVRNITNPRTLAITGSAAGAAAIAGQIGPQVLLPEEIVTVPAAAAAGFAAASAGSALEMEAGLAYNEMVEAGISKETAKKIATGVGVVNAGLEAAQIDELVDALRVLGGKKTTKTFTQRIIDELVDRGVDVAKETAQEVLQEGVTIAGTQVGSKVDKGEWAYSADEVLGRLGDTAASSALSFGIMNVPAGAKNIMSTVSDQKVNNTLTDNEQKVFDKVYEDRVAEAEKNGKLTKNEKAKLYDQVMEDMEKGYISTDTIESVLGGEDYKTYKGSLDGETSLKTEMDALENEYKTLTGKEGKTLADTARIDEIQSKYRELKAKMDDENRIGLKNSQYAKLQKNVYELTKNERLRESYFEQVRSKQKFEVDLSKYEGRAKEVMQQVMESELVDNTNRSHEFWDVAFAIHDDSVSREPIGKLVSERETQVGTVTEFILVLERFHDVAVSPELFLEVELGSRNQTTVQGQVTGFPRYHGVLDVGDTLVIRNIVRLADVHYTFYRKSLVQFVFVTQVAAFQIEATVVVFYSET